MEICRSVSMGMAYLHSHDPIILHLDLKPGNVLLGLGDEVKIADFGVSVLKNQIDDNEARGTAKYIAPELWKTEPFDEKADVYSFSVMLLECYMQQEPYYDYTDWTEIEQIMTHVIAGKRPTVPTTIPETLNKLLQECWYTDAKKRPPFSEITTRMDQVILECVIPTHEGRNIWNNNFSQALTVDIDKFCSILFDTFGKDAKREKALKFIFDAKISIEDFGNALMWFGPLPEPFFHNIIYLYDSEWYHHKLPDKQAKTLLANKNNGWLIKLGNNPGEFELMTAGWNALIYATPAGELWYDGITFKDWHELFAKEIDKFGIDLKEMIINVKD